MAHSSTSPKNLGPKDRGDVRQALIDAGLSLLRSGGTQALTLRKCAVLAGVSHAAPAHHFVGLDGLRLAIAEEGFDLFRLHMLREAEGAVSDRGRLTAICRGYIKFAREEPAIYDHLFSFRRPPDRETPKEIPQNDPAYRVLANCCAPFVPPGEDPVVLETQVWSLCHGYALFVLSGRFSADEAMDRDVLASIDRIAGAV